MAKAIVLREYGGPENLRLETVETGTADDASILIRNVAIGVNFIDTYFRRGIYPTTLPAVIGDQGVGIVEECGSAGQCTRQRLRHMQHGHQRLHG